MVDKHFVRHTKMNSQRNERDMGGLNIALGVKINDTY